MVRILFLVTIGTFPTKKRSQFDKILLFSDASKVHDHTVKDGWLIINTGDQFGRVYWEVYECAEFSTTQLGFNTIITGVFRMHGLGKSDSSVKLGNHGTDGYDFDGKKFFGGFGVSFQPKEIQSKCEWKHDTPEGKELAFEYLHETQKHIHSYVIGLLTKMLML